MKLVLTVFLGLSFCLHVSAQATLTGTVTGSGFPLRGAGVEVYEFSSSTLVSNTLTEPDGTYYVDGLTVKQQYLVRFCHPKYMPAHDEVTAPGVLDRKLNLPSDSEFWQALSQEVVRDFKTHPQDENSFRDAWSRIESLRVPAFGKAMIARDVKEELKDSPEVWSRSITFKAYCEASPEVLELAEMDYWMDRPNNTFYALNPAIADNIRKVHPPLTMELSARGPCQAMFRQWKPHGFH